LALIDISLPGRSGLWLAKAIAEKQPGVPCLMLSGYPITLYVREAMASGARGYILKDDVPGILEGIHQVLAGGTFISQALRGR
jgi:DNA-binding NarL/FixJ family response regulator